MKNLSDDQLKIYLSKISDETLYAYNVYQIEGEGRNLFSIIEGDEDTIMGLPIKKIKEYLRVRMLILIWFLVCIIFYLVQQILGNSGHALEVFALLTGLALFVIDRLSKKMKK